MGVDTLHTLVSAAICREQQLEGLGTGAAPPAWTEVCALDEGLAQAIPTVRPEGRIARREAACGALNAGERAPAHELAQRCSDEHEACDALRGTLQEMPEADAQRPSSAPGDPHPARRRR